VLSSAARSIFSMGVNSSRFLLSDSRGSGFVLLLLKSSFSLAISVKVAFSCHIVRVIFNTDLHDVILSEYCEY